MTYEIVDAREQKREGLIACTQFMVFCSIVDGALGTLIIADFYDMQQMQFYESRLKCQSEVSHPKSSMPWE